MKVSQRKKSKVNKSITQSFAETAERVSEAHAAVTEVENKNPNEDSPSRAKDGIGKVCPLDRVVVKENIRSSIPDDTQYRQLKQSISDIGLVQPLVCRLEPDNTLTLIAGHRRLKALQELGITEAPVVIRSIDAKSEVYAQLSENMCRTNMELLDVAEAMHLLFRSGYERKELEAVFEKDRMYVSRCLKIAKWSDEIKDTIRSKKISARNVMKIAARSLTDSEILSLLSSDTTSSQFIASKDLNQKAKSYLEEKGIRMHGRVKLTAENLVRCTIDLPLDQVQ